MIEHEPPEKKYELYLENSTSTRFGEIKKFKIVFPESKALSIFHNKYIVGSDLTNHIEDVLEARELANSPNLQKSFKKNGTSINSYINLMAIQLVNEINRNTYFKESTSDIKEIAILPLIRQKAMELIFGLPENP